MSKVTCRLSFYAVAMFKREKFFSELVIDLFIDFDISFILACNCNYILFTKLPWPGDSEMTFRSSSQAEAQLSTTHDGGFTLSL